MLQNGCRTYSSIFKNKKLLCIDKKSFCNGSFFLQKMVALGFEPRHLSVMGLESIALDHSAKLPYIF